MTDDPRERIETEHVRCSFSVAGTWLIESDREDIYPCVPWPELVELAQKILAANEAWLDGQTPTLEELRAKYDGKWHVSARRHGLCFEAEIMPHGSVSNPTYCDGFDTEKQAIRWLVDVIEDRGVFAATAWEEQERSQRLCDHERRIEEELTDGK